MPLAKLYTNSLMSNLNSRSGWEGSDSKQGAPGSLSERGNGMRLQQLKHSVRLPTIVRSGISDIPGICRGRISS